MDGQEAKKIIKQIRNIVLSRPNSQEIMLDSPEWRDVQDAMTYLYDCINETNTFLRNISSGELDVKPPSRMNFMASELKELQSNLRHMTWQANQVANGDYNQRLRFLGEFSDSFNTMIDQLSQRESELKQQADALIKSTELLELIMDGLTECIIVTGLDDGKILYVNNAAKKIFCENRGHDMEHICGKDCELLKHVQSNDFTHDQIKYVTCKKTNRNFKFRFYLISWNNIKAVAHIISDITQEQYEKERLERMAFKDELTGLYNRRYFVKEMEKILKSKTPFSLCSIDINGLKYANDFFGHIAGDDYIKTVADEMWNSIRVHSDTVCRVGGDEFAMILPECTEEVAISKLEKIAEKIKERSKEYPMSISFGVYYADENTELSMDEIISIADMRMYELKRNQKQSTKQYR